MKKISLIQASNEELCQDFNSKCETFIKAMYSKSPEINQDIATQETSKSELNSEKWQSLSDNEVKQVITTSSLKKVSESDEISFAII